MLTIVVPTVPGRESLLSRCLHSLTGQAAAVLVVDGDGRLGDKVNTAAQHIRTDYMAVVDDDDYVTGDYVSSITPLLGVADYVGFRFLELDSGSYFNTSASSAEFNVWGRRNRGPVPKGVTRTSIFRSVPFGNDYFADRMWSKQTRSLITSWEFVDRVLYVHDWWETSSTFHDNGHRDVGQWPHRDVERLTVN